MRMTVFTRLLAPLAMAWPLGAEASQDAVALGYREDTEIRHAQPDDCLGALTFNHDDSFENAYCWQIEGVAPPYYGAWGEAYDLGAATIECGVFWFTTVSNFIAPPIDVYVWDGGAYGPPGEVLSMITDVTVSLAFWPVVYQNNIEIGCSVTQDFTVGYWEPAQGQLCYIFCAADENGPDGNPWTNIAPGIGYPTGWHHPCVVHLQCVSMGIGATVTEYPSAVAGPTWGMIKGIFQE